MEINKEELENFIRQYSFILSIHIKMLQGKWVHEVTHIDGLIYLRVFFDKVAVSILNRDWNDYLLSDYIQFQRERKINSIFDISAN